MKKLEEQRNQFVFSWDKRSIKIVIKEKLDPNVISEVFNEMK